MATKQGEPNRFFHEVVLAYDGDECLAWPFGCNDKGYGQLHQNGANKRVNRLVCEHVNGPPPTPKHEAAHSCGNGHLGCCAKRHLSWKTKAENQADRLIHGTHHRGVQHPRAKLSLDDVDYIRVAKESHSQLSKRFGVSGTTISFIQNNKRWSYPASKEGGR